MVRRLSAPAVLALLLACSGESPTPSVEIPGPPGALTLPSLAEVQADLAPLSFDDFVERSFLQLTRRSPEALVSWQLEDQLPENAGRLDDLSEGFVVETDAVAEAIRAQLETYDPTALTEEQQLTRDAYAWFLEDLHRTFEYRDYNYQATHVINGEPANTELFFSEIHPLKTEADARAYVARLWTVDDKLIQLSAQLKRRADAGLAPPRMAINWVLGRLTFILDAGPTRTPYYGAFEYGVNRLLDVPPATRSELLQEAANAVRYAVQPGYAVLNDTLLDIAAVAPTAVGVGVLEGGVDYYAEVLRHHTTTASTADEIHALGIRELARIHAEMRSRFDALGYPSDETLEESFARVAEDGGLAPAAEVVQAYTDIIRGAEARMSEAFDLQPSAAVTVIGSASGGGFYIGPSLDGERPGAFYASANEQPRFAMATLAYHEAVPGHHTQIGIATDLELPFFRRVINATAYTEGWALYAERLAYDLDWYDGDPYGDLGRLQAEAFRAARLVVDTGIHAKGWDFTRARDYFQEATGFDPRNISADGQIARYIAWPGQSTAYMMGMLKILELRERAQAALGPRFDLVAFHRMVLGGGSLPLPVLEARARRWIEAQR
ncbi:MAG: DUF885 domain-containing protein [Deltaproteobacteria bacterium]|nr:DUF885 domain-containing protein [Deltaproteobacteria bacterium]